MNVSENYNVNFNGVYRMKYTPENLKALKEKIIPTYEYIRRQPIDYFIGSNPFTEALIDVGVEEVAELQNYSTQWVEQNAKNNGIKLDEIKKRIIYVITGKTDCDAIVKYSLKVLESLDYEAKGVFGKMKMILDYYKNSYKASLQSVPEYLFPLVRGIIDEEEQTKYFNDNFLKSRNIKDYSNPMELLNAIMAGR